MSTLEILQELMFRRFGNVTLVEHPTGITVLSSDMSPSTEVIEVWHGAEGRYQFRIGRVRLPLSVDQFKALITVSPAACSLACSDKS